MNLTFVLKILLVGQFQCITFTGCGIFTQFLKEVNLQTPVFNSFFLYIFMLSLFFFKFARRNTANKWGYLLASIFDFIGLITLILAFQLTKLASVTLVSVFGVISAAIASIFILKLRYKWIHFLSIGICTCGVIITIYSDLFNKQGELDLGNVWGDIMGIIASSAYGLSSTISQKLLGKKGNIWSLLSYFGLYGLLLGTIGFFAHREYEVIQDFQAESDHNNLNFLLYFGYGAIAFINYAITIFFIKIAGAATVNLNALTNTLWTMAADYFIFKREFVRLIIQMIQQIDQKWIAVVGYIVIIVGVVLFHVKQPIEPKKTSEIKNEKIQQNSSQIQNVEKYAKKPFLSVRIQSDDMQTGSRMYKSDVESMLKNSIKSEEQH